MTFILDLYNAQSVLDFIYFIAPLIAIVGILLSAAARKEEKSPAAKAGLILSIIGFVISLFICVICYVLVSSFRVG